MPGPYQLSDEFLHEAQRLVYREWCLAFDNLKSVQKETSDGHADWHLFHVTRLSEANKRFDLCKKLLDEINRIAPLTKR